MTSKYISWPGTSLKFHRDINRALAFATIHKEPRPLPRYGGIGDIPSVDSANQTNALSPGVTLQHNETAQSACRHLGYGARLLETSGKTTIFLGIWSNTWGGADSRETTKWFWLFVSGFECKNQPQIRAKIEKMHKYALELRWKAMESKERWATFNVSVN
jgi:hypothetical protein